MLDHPSPHVTALLDALAERTDCVAKVLYFDRLAPGRSWGAPPGTLPFSFLEGITFPGGLRVNPGIFRSLAHVKADIWVVNSIYTSPSTLLAVWWLHRRKIPWIYMNEPPRPRKWFLSLFKRPILSYVLSRAWGVASTGKRAAELYQGILARPKPVGAVPYYIDTESFDQFAKSSPDAPNGIVRFVTSSRLTRAKGMDVLQRACMILPDQGWSLTVAGDGPLRDEMERVFAARRTSDQVRFVGQISYQARASVFTGKDVFLLPSLWDGWGMVIPEALAAGLPVITTDQVMSAHELVRDGINGFVVPAGDPAVFAEKMDFFLKHPEKTPEMAVAAREELRDYKPSVGAERLVSLLREVLSPLQPILKKPQLRTSASQPSWQELTDPKDPLTRARRDIRQASKAAICRTGVILRSNTKPSGHRILVYHLILPADRKRFEEHLRFLKDHFLIGSVTDVVAAAKNNGSTGSYRLAITFDDGFRILMGDCLDVLEKFNVKACFLAPTAFVQAHNDPELSATFSLRAHHYSLPLEPLRPTDLKLLTDLGHEVGSHGIYHLSLGMVGEKMAKNLLVDSRAQIGEWTGKAPFTFAYPYGEVKNSAGEPASWVEKAGYSYGLTLQRGRVLPSTSQFLLPREHAEGNWSLYAMRYFLSI